MEVPILTINKFTVTIRRVTMKEDRTLISAVVSQPGFQLRSA